MADDFPFRNADMDDNRAVNGGTVPVKDVRQYQPPAADVPMRKGPGIGGTVLPCGTQGKH